MNLHRALAAALAVAALQFSPAQAEPLKIRMAWVVTPASLIPIMFLKDGVAKHLGKSYVIEDTRIGASSQQITAIASNQIDIAALNYSSMSLAVLNGGLEDLRIIADEIMDGHPGYFSVTYWVRKDSGINRVEDLKGKTLAVNGLGTGVHMALTMVMEKHNMKPQADYSLVEVQFQNMAATLADKKVDLAEPPTAFTENPAFQAMAKPLFYMKDALGPSTLSFWTARKDYIAKNRAVLVDLIEDYIRAVRWYNDPKNHDEAVELVAKYTKVPAATYKGWLFTKKDFYRDPNALVDIEALQRNVNDAAKQGAIPKPIVAKTYEDLSLAKEAAARIK
jgi:NitT/TauT family transport system substrate-binding protein